MAQSGNAKHILIDLLHFEFNTKKEIQIIPVEGNVVNLWIVFDESFQATASPDAVLLRSYPS